MCHLAVTDQIPSAGAGPGFAGGLREEACAVSIALGSTFVKLVPAVTHRSNILPLPGNTCDGRGHGVGGAERGKCRFAEENPLQASLITRRGIFRCEFQRAQATCVSEGGRKRRRGRHCLSSVPSASSSTCGRGSEGQLLPSLLRAVLPSLRRVTACVRPAVPWSPIPRQTPRLGSRNPCQPNWLCCVFLLHAGLLLPRPRPTPSRDGTLRWERRIGGPCI